MTAMDTARRALTLATDHIHTLPVLVLMPHSACNCRCVMCDIWRANANRRELAREDLAPHVDSIRRLGVRWVTLSGGEALMHSNLWMLCTLLREAGVRRITVLSTGLLLARHAEAVVRHADEVIVSLDGSREIHDAIRNVPRAFDRLAEGVAALRERAPGFRVTARCVVQRRNFRDMPEIVRAAHALGLDGVSFLAADVSSTAFNRPEPWSEARVADVALTPEDLPEFAAVLAGLARDFAADLEGKYIAESPEKLGHILRYYAALCGQGELPAHRCNAPWVSAVVEADGAVRPCFFHPAYGHLGDAPLEQTLNSPAAVAFRRALDVSANPICRKCVCTLYLGPRAEVG
jgi:MoaA/NifB/PqqE/SkfB family radical SAM enzyme